MVRTTGRDANRRSVAAATFAAGGVIAHQVVGKTTRDSFFLSNYDVELLPIVMIAAAVLAGAAVLGFSRLLTIYSPARAVPFALAANVLFLLLEWALSLAAPEMAALAVYAHMSIFGGILVSGFWSLYNERFDPYAAKQAMGRVGTGGSVGGVAGGLAALSLANVVPPSSLLIVMALLASATLAGVVIMSRGAHTKARASSRDTDTDAEGPTSGLQVVREVPYLRTLALIVGLSAATEALLDYVLAAQAKASAASDAELVTFFSLFYTGVGLAGLLIQAFAARRSLELFGLAGSVALKPASYVLGGLLGAMLPRLSTAVIIRALPAILHNSVYRSGYELLYTPLPDRQKRPAKALVDVGADKLGMIVGGTVTLLVVALAADAAVQVLPAIAVVFGVLVLALCRRVEGGYIAALEASLRSGAVTLTAEQIIDSSTRLSMLHSQLATGQGQALAPEGDPGSTDPIVQMIRDLHSKDPLRMRTVLRAPELEPGVVTHVIPLLGQDDLARDAVRALRTVVARATGQLIDALVDK